MISRTIIRNMLVTLVFAGAVAVWPSVPGASASCYATFTVDDDCSTCDQRCRELGGSRCRMAACEFNGLLCVMAPCPSFDCTCRG